MQALLLCLIKVCDLLLFGKEQKISEMDQRRRSQDMWFSIASQSWIRRPYLIFVEFVTCEITATVIAVCYPTRWRPPTAEGHFARSAVHREEDFDKRPYGFPYGTASTSALRRAATTRWQACARNISNSNFALPSPASVTGMVGRLRPIEGYAMCSCC